MNILFENFNNELIFIKIEEIQQIHVEDEQILLQTHHKFFNFPLQNDNIKKINKIYQILKNN
jgi:hypothetical protein